MIRQYKKIYIIISILLSFFFISRFSMFVYANDEDSAIVSFIGGNLVFTTTDTKASTKTTWETIGFNITLDEISLTQNGGDPTKYKHTTIYLSEGEKHVGDEVNGKVEVTFIIPEKVVNKALEESGMDEYVDNKRIIYLHGIFAVKKGGNIVKTNIKTLKGIMEAESWANPNDFKDRFNVRVPYERNEEKTYPISIEYQLYKTTGTEILDTKKFAEMKYLDKFKTESSKIPNKKNGYYLYRVYYTYVNKPNKKLGNRKVGMNPNFFYNEYIEELKFVRDREYTVKGDGLKIVAMYREFSNKVPSEGSEEMEREYEEIDPTGTIGSNSKGNELFDITLGIPSTESLYANFSTSKYLSGYKFVRKYGTKVYPTRVKQHVTLHWSEWEERLDETTGEIIRELVPKTDNKDIYKTYVVERKYSYWQIESLGIYGLDNATVQTDALPNTVTITPKGYITPTVTYKQSNNEKDHIKEPIIKEVVLEPITKNQSTWPDDDWRKIAEESVKKIKCKNDSLIINSEVIMIDEELEEETTKPKAIPDGLELIGEDVLYQENLVIPGEKANGEYLASGTVTYKPIVEINTESPTLEYEIDLSSVIVHTPTVCDAMIQDNYKDNQMIYPTYGMASLILDKPFYVTLPTTGTHRFILGYGYRDYAKYISSREVRFPFDVYKGSSINGSFIPKNTWTSISEDTQFFLPTWVKEGQYTIDFKSIAINASANNATGKTENLANLSLENYVATDTTSVEVSGRVYGFSLYDITDYPTWEDVFRLYAGTTKLSGFRYPVGTKNQDGVDTGRNSKYTLAMINGVHPKYKNIGAINTGYATRFTLKTIGSMNNENDYIRIIPTFYYVDSKGQNRKEVDIYYSETFNGKINHMVKMGGALDLENKKSITTGDVYLSINEKELYQTAILKGMNLKALKAQKRNVFTYTNIMLPESLRTFVGYINNVPGTVNKDDVAKSVQNWYGEYYLPSEIHVTAKDFDVLEYSSKNGGLNYNESFWLKDGYVIVNFQIETIKNGTRHLSYINSENAQNGYCNMWQREGFQYEKVDYYGNKFTFQDGDYVLYYTNKSAAQDWISAGTH